MKILTKVPKNGFYFHYKHDPLGEINNYTYEVIGVGRHTEDQNYSFLYRPLYINTFLVPATYCLRPLEMFLETVEREVAIVERFQKITDPTIIEQLSKIRDDM